MRASCAIRVEDRSTFRRLAMIVGVVYTYIDEFTTHELAFRQLAYQLSHVTIV